MGIMLVDRRIALLILASHSLALSGGGSFPGI